MVQDDLTARITGMVLDNQFSAAAELLFTFDDKVSMAVAALAIGREIERTNKHCYIDFLKALAAAKA